jgi:hypothetical protein
VHQNNAGSVKDKFALNETISKLQGALLESGTQIQLVEAIAMLRVDFDGTIKNLSDLEAGFPTKVEGYTTGRRTRFCF